MKQAKFETRRLADLKNWENNPRSILKDDFDRLKGQIQELGVYKTLLINQDNIVLGGNMRLRAFTEIFGKDHEVMCGIVQTEDEGDMLRYALSDNDQAGTTDDLKLAEVYHLHPIEMELYKVQSNILRPLKHIINPPDPVTEGGEGQDRSELDQDLDSSLSGNIKQIVLYYANEQYGNIIERLEKMLERTGTKTHTDCFDAMMAFCEANMPEAK